MVVPHPISGRIDVALGQQDVAPDVGTERLHEVGVVGPGVGQPQVGVSAVCGDVRQQTAVVAFDPAVLAAAERVDHAGERGVARSARDIGVRAC